MNVLDDQALRLLWFEGSRIVVNTSAAEAKKSRSKRKNFAIQAP